MADRNYQLDAVIVREAIDDFDALQIANAMQTVTCVEVFSIVCQPLASPLPNVSARWYVFAKFASAMVTTYEIDEAIRRVVVCPNKANAPKTPNICNSGSGRVGGFTSNAAQSTNPTADKLERIRTAIGEYHEALNRMANANSAAWAFIDACEEILG
jgi:hypothetical protein